VWDVTLLHVDAVEVYLSVVAAGGVVTHVPEPPISTCPVAVEILVQVMLYMLFM
jgi:hypothetical protein